MKNKLTGIIIYSKKIKDNDLYIKVLSSNDEIISGMVYGGNSSKKKLIYQNGYFIDYFLTKRNENSPKIFTADIGKPFIGNIYKDKYKLYALLSILSLINLSILEGQKIKGYYKSVFNLYNNIIEKKHWIIFYCEWLFDLLKLIGYQIDYKNNNDKYFFNTLKQEFSDNFEENCIEFPHNFFSKKENTNFKNLNLIFLIFESIFIKNHLDNINYQMPNNYVNFKKTILQRLN